MVDGNHYQQNRILVCLPHMWPKSMDPETGCGLPSTGQKARLNDNNIN